MTLAEAYKILTHVSILSVLVPLIICILKRKALHASMKALFVYLCICLLSDVLSFLFFKNEYLLNLIVNSFTVLECVIICIIYFLEFERKDSKIIVCLIAGIFLVLALWQFIFRSLFGQEDTFISSLEAIIIMILSATYVIKFLISQEIVNLKDYYFFWIVLSNLTYFSTAFIFFLFRHYIMNAPHKFSYLIWGFHDLINISCYVLFTIGIWKIQKK